jgi:DNA-binding MarR family transcriptional regulator
VAEAIARPLRSSAVISDAIAAAPFAARARSRRPSKVTSVRPETGAVVAAAERARLSPGATTALLDRLEEKGLARRARDTQDRRRVLVEVTPGLRRGAEQLYGTPEEGARALDAYSDEQLEFLIGFLHGSVAFQEERMRRLETLKAQGPFDE